MVRFSSYKIVLGVLVIFCAFLCWDNMEKRVLKSTISDLELRLAQSSQQVHDTLFIRDSIPVWRERVIEVDRSDYKESLADKKLIKDLQLRLNQVEAENRFLMGTRDTVYLEKANDSVLRYRDQWADFSFYERDNRLEYSVKDSLTTIIAREYRHKFLWFRWGTKGYSVYHVNHNPHSKIMYNKYIKVK